MSIEQAGVIDIIAEDKGSKTVTLGYEHVVMLQRKINAYVAFAKDGEMAERFPERSQPS